MKSSDVINYFGSVAKTAKALGMTHQAIYAWGEKVPKTRQAHIDSLTQGKIPKGKDSDL